ncbi:hypothetical protein [Paenibacillus typhae]|uniref:Uncharacterized protein n=1 Tax=Paenibacillus typhae TaxID=1174501 RepID=A0A1G9E6G7_9BACL|nr:hypothetical protein [Paenibacillus typhae]SDK71705.1 hypothetical protein SAMN05216192_15134 [Paenibacillus typhae]
MNTRLSQKEWLEYINRLQERERQKIISSGLSNWTLFAALAGLGYWIFPDIIDIQKHWMTVILGYIFFQNLTTTIFDIFNKHYRQEKIIKMRKAENLLEKKGTLPLKIHGGLIELIALILNIFFAIHSHINNFWIFEAYFIINSFRFSRIIDVILNRKEIMSSWRELRRNNNVRVNETETVKKTSKIQKGLTLILDKSLQFINGISAKLIITVIMLTYASTQYNFNDLLWKQLFNGLALVIIVVLSQFLLVIFLKRMKIAWLEELEKEILLTDLKENQIIKKLRNGYFNFSNIDNYF